MYESQAAAEVEHTEPLDLSVSPGPRLCSTLKNIEHRVTRTGRVVKPRVIYSP